MFIQTDSHFERPAWISQSRRAIGITSFRATARTARPKVKPKRRGTSTFIWEFMVSSL